MSTMQRDNWYAANQCALSAALDVVRQVLEHKTTKGQADVECLPTKERPQRNMGADSSSVMAQSALSSDGPDLAAPPSALEALCEAFGLSAFERAILLLCAGIELDASFAALCARVQGDAALDYPTFSLALTALHAPHWSALAPDAPLRYWRLIEIAAGNTLTMSPLRIDERVLHYLMGVQHIDARLEGLIEPVYVSGDIVPSQRTLADRLAATWSSASTATVLLPVLQLCGNDTTSKRAIASAACNKLSLQLYALPWHAVPHTTSELYSLVRLWEREAILSSSALLLECDDLDTSDLTRVGALNRVIEHLHGALLLSSRERWRILQRPLLAFDVQKPAASEQRDAWRCVLGDTAQMLNGQVDQLVAQFNLSAATIQELSYRLPVAYNGPGSERLSKLDAVGDSAAMTASQLGRTLWDACRVQARARLDGLAQPIEPIATWDNLVLPEQQRVTLRDIVAQVRQRTKVYETWGFAARCTRGMGISALFSGVSGTGKTMAAEVIANELRLDLYHIDLSQMVSKYIGETEKNLRRVFDAAEESGALLLFDEADALFGKRGEVRDSHDRYANIEVSYLLQRMESYRGLAILTTNMKSALDSAFLRRIRFIVLFPFPDSTLRADIWKRIFPASTPTDNLDVSKLARLNVAGGNIRNIALNAAFSAADKGEPVRMAHLLYAARSEYAKLEKPLTEAEIGGWI